MATSNAPSPARLAAAWAVTARARPGRTFLIWEDQERDRVAQWTYGEFDALAWRCAAALRQQCGNRPVLLALPNSPAFVAVWLGCLLAGITVVPVDPRATPRELDEHARHVTAALLVAPEARRAELTDQGPAAPGWWIDPAAADGDAGLAAYLPAGVGSETGPMPEAGRTAAIMFTSGTTSRAKGVLITQALYGVTASVMAAASGMTADDRCLVALPLFHANAQYYSVGPAILTGATVCLVPAFSASRYLAQAARLEATHASLFAAPLRMILDRHTGPVPRLRLRHLWYAQNLSDEQYRECVRLLGGLRPRQLYGMTETGPAVLMNDAADPHPQRLGRPTAGCRVELHDEAGRPVPAGEVGEIVVGGRPGVELFAGYHAMPDVTAASFGNGLFRTGDLAVRHPDGQWAFAGRRGDNLKVAGENVSVVEIEERLRTHPEVLDVAVVGVPDPVRDEIPWAFVVPAGGDGTGPGDLTGFAAEQLAPAKRPRGYTLLDRLPYTAVGKVRRHELKQIWRRDCRDAAGLPGREAR